MSDPSTLRNLLRKADMTAPGIQGTAGAMMKHYDRSPGVAVVEWRNALQQARLDQHLPLLYVANETLQNSKRNRGNKFLEAFSPILGQALTFMCQKNPSVVEKVRRTIKIWGDRHVFSVRYVNELLKGLEPFRNGSVPPPSPATTPEPFVVPGGATFSPVASPPGAQASKPAPSAPAPFDIDKAMASSDEGSSQGYSDNEDDGGAMDEDNIFGDSGDRLLNIELDLDKAASALQKTANSNTRKRRRPSNAAGGGTSGRSKRRHSILSTDTLMDVWTQISDLQQRFDNTQTVLSGISPDYLDESKVAEQIDTLVGDELLAEYKKVAMMEKRVVDQRKALHEIANKRRTLEKESVRFLPWLETALKQDEEEVEFCNQILKKLDEYETLQELVQEARDKRLQEEERKQLETEELERVKKEEEERKKFMETAMHKNMEAKPGMVWNREAGEYVYPNTDESWRDH